MGFDGISKNITWDRNKEIFHVNTDAKKDAEKPAKMEISPRNTVLVTANVSLW